MKIRFPGLLFFLAISLLVSLSVSGQIKCGVPHYQELQKKLHPQLENKEGFEEWIAEKAKRKNRKANGTLRQAQQIVYQLPVVVHVIHKGEPVGTGTNISNNQIIRQLEILNTDYRRLNEAQINALPPEFKKLAADTEIEFVLARQDPEGLPTSGITRTRSSNLPYSMDDDLELKGLIHWPPHDYINIYVTDLIGLDNQELLGYSQFPETDKLQGLDLGQVSARTDGIAIDYQYFGTGGSALSSGAGRTLTHEMGHYLGLRHIWGDGNCEADDFVEDTPLSSKSYDGYSNCSGIPESCGSRDMFQNFLSYANDECMALFTAGQKERMLVVLQHSPRRKELNNSHGKEAPVVVANDAGIMLFEISVVDPCTKSFIPSVTIRNYGNNQLQEAELGIFINGVQVLYEQFNNLNLGYLKSVTKTLNPVIVTAKGELIIEARILSVNGTADGKPFNNQARTDIFVPYFVSPPILQDFETALSPFYRINPDYYLTWQITDAPVTGDPDNRAIYMNYYDYDLNIGTRDLLVSPIINLNESPEAFLSFRVAYAPYQSDSPEGLEVYVTTSCSESIEDAQLIFRKTGKDLATAPSMNQRFVPVGNESWRTEQIDLSQFSGEQNLQIIFAGVNDYGNNLYLDNIEILTEPRKQLDVALQSIRSPSVVSCNTNPVPAVNIRNAGREEVNSLELLYSFNGGGAEKVTFPGLKLGLQENIQLELPMLNNLAEGTYTYSVRVVGINNEFDENPKNDFLAKKFVVDSSKDIIPLRQYFSGSDPLKEWVNVSPAPDKESWILTTVSAPSARENKAAVSEFFESTAGTENWLVSPVLDLSKTEKAGVQFRHSYASLSSASDILQLRASSDCGESWTILFEKRGNELSSRSANARWSPSVQADWDTSFVNLSSFAGQAGVRVAFVAISGGGNDIFVDNIEFFESATPPTGRIPALNTVYLAPNPATISALAGKNDLPKLVFNLEEREDVHVWVYDTRGSLKLETILPNVLNQVFYLEIYNWNPGVYIIRAQSENLKESLRLVLLK